MTRRADAAPRPGQEGYNLLELVMVCSIIGLVLIAAVPTLRNRTAIYQAEGAARELSSRMQVARQRAIATRTPYRVVIDRGARSYHVEYRDTDSTWTETPEGEFEMGGVAALEASIGGSETDEEIEFWPRGTVADEDSPAEILVFSTQGDTASLSLVRTGRVTLALHPAD